MPHTSSSARPSPPGRTLSYLACATLVAALALLATPSKPVAAASTVTVVMSGLDNPRGLAFGAQGALYVAEAGRGGNGPCFFLRGGTRCFGVGNAYVTVGFQTDPGRRAELGPAAAGFAQLARLTASGDWRYIMDLGA